MRELPLSSPSPFDGSRERLMDELVDEMVRRIQAGEAVDLDAYAARYPDLAPQLRATWPAIRMLSALSCSDEGELHGLVDVADRSASHETIVERVLGDFRIVREVGRGGMGIVYEAEQISLGRRVALKVLPLAGMLDERQLVRFKNEARAAAGLRHDNIVDIYSVGCDRGVHYYAMQFVEGQTLASLVQSLRRKRSSHEPSSTSPTLARDRSSHSADGESAGDDEGGRVAGEGADTHPWATLSTQLETSGPDYFRAIARLGVQTAEALDCAHEHGVVHRDIKPANILVDASGKPWITDFGLARIEADAQVTATGAVVGTLRYMSPEQALGQRALVDHRTDIYSLGVTLYELLALRPAFPEEDRRELLHQIAASDPPLLRRINAAIPRDLETIVLKAIQKRPAERFARAQELADDLRRFLDHRPIQARPPTPVQVAAKWFCRHPRLSGAGVGVAAMLALALICGALLYARQTSRVADRRAELNRKIAESLAEAEIARVASQSSLQDLQSWARAREFSRRALTLVELEAADPELAERARALAKKLDAEQADRKLLSAIKQARSAQDELDDRASRFRREAGLPLFAAAFREWGASPEQTAVQAAADRILAAPPAVRQEALSALEEWRQLELQRENPTEENRRRAAWLGALVSRVDADPWRERMRRALRDRDMATADALAQSIPGGEQPRLFLLLVGEALIDLSKGVAPEKTGTSGASAPSSHELFDRGLALLLEAWRRAPDDYTINKAIWIAFTYSRPPRHEEALRYASICAAVRPDDPAARLPMGLALQNLGRNAEAVEVYRRIIADNPAQITAHTNLGNALHALGDYEAAKAAHLQAIALCPDSPALYNNLGTLLGARGDHAGAAAQFRTAISIDPNYLRGHCNLGTAASEMGDLAQAAVHFRYATKLDPLNAGPHVSLGEVLLRQGDLPAARVAFETAIRLDPTNAQGHQGLANALDALGQPDAARRSFERAIALQPRFADAHYNLALLLSAQGDRTGAEHQYRQAIEDNPNMAEAHCNLAGLLKDQGKLAEAVEEYRIGHELGKKAPGWRYPSAAWLAEAERLFALQGDLAEFLSSGQTPGDSESCFVLAESCLDQQRYAASVRLYEKGLELAAMSGSPVGVHRYNAACAAAMASDQRGDVGELPVPEQERLRQQALTWLELELARVLELQQQQSAAPPVESLRGWLTDPQLAPLREDQGLSRLGDDERASWEELWDSVRDLVSEESSDGGCPPPSHRS